MKQLLYRIIYNRHINWLLRNIYLTLFHRGKKAPFPVSGKLTFDVQGTPLKLWTNESCHVTTLIYWGGGPEGYEYTSAFIALAPHINSFLDIGAQLGYYSLLAKLKNPNATVYTFEPSPGPLHYLERNVKENGLEGKINVMKLAISGDSGKISFYENFSPKYPYIKYPLRGGNNFAAPNTQASRKFDVDTLTLDDFVAKYNVKQIDLIKLDTEGTEDIIVKAGVKTINELRPIIICEVLPQTIQVAKNIRQTLEGTNYGFFYIQGKNLVEEDSMTRKGMPDDVTDYFIVPREKVDFLKKVLAGS